MILETALIYNDSDTIERNIQQTNYLNYIKEHIQNVIKAFEIFFQPILEDPTVMINSEYYSDQEFRDACRIAEENIQHHDDSKFSDDEFDGYRAKYFPTKAEEVDDDFQKLVNSAYQNSWYHHYKHNHHHPLYWMDEETNTPKDMSLDAIIEMICDWEAMSIKMGQDTLDWYENHAQDEKKAMTEKTKSIVEDILYNIVHGSKNRS